MTADVITLVIPATEQQIVDDLELGRQAARDRLLIDTPLTVINAGLDLSYDTHTRAYVGGFLELAVDAALILVSELNDAVTAALENVD